MFRILWTTSTRSLTQHIWTALKAFFADSAEHHLAPPSGIYAIPAPSENAMAYLLI